MVEMAFAERLLAWQRVHGRHDLPWQVSDPYRVWLSEIMLQQTQVTAVLQYYSRFLQRFPSLESLALAPLDDVVALWSGLGYYSRARNLHRAAQMVMNQFSGVFPSERQQIELLPGVGRSTAAAISAFCFGRREAILDGNVKRVLTRVFGIDGFPGDKKIETGLWQLAESLLPQQGIEAYTQGLMDLGATLCRRSRPACERCPLAASCVALRENRVASLPTPRPKKISPTRYTTMLLLLHGGEVFLERRPPSGIWGGLLSLPECLGQQEAEARLMREGVGDVLPSWHEFEHVFTHFRLIITPQPIRLTHLSSGVVRELDGCWLPFAVACEAGVPAPVKRLLQKLITGPI
jgi:A/G-specific adenine glycosylase